MAIHQLHHLLLVLIVKGRYDNSLVGFFVGKNLAFPVVQNYVNNVWSKFGLEKLMKSDDGVYLFKFSSKSGKEQVLERGPWMIRKPPIILNKWSSSMSLKKGEVTKVTVWIKMHNVPLLAYSEDGLSLIATQIGKPIMLDAFTSSMCVESWGRIGFARALIEVSSESDLEKEVIMAIPHEEGDHIVPTTCPNHVKEVAHKAPSMAANKPSPMKDHKEGFVEVKNRKEKGKAGSNQHHRIKGIKLSKPNSNFQYRSVSKPGKDMDDASNLGANDPKEGSSSQPTIAKASIVDKFVLTKNSFDALMDSNNSFEANEANKQTSSEWSKDFESDDEVDKVLYPEGNKFEDQFDIRLKG
ncbi:reverse transcriptase domain-containing protein [Tanacetum coccineum]